MPPLWCCRRKKYYALRCLASGGSLDGCGFSNNAYQLYERRRYLYLQRGPQAAIIAATDGVNLVKANDESGEEAAFRHGSACW